MPAALLGLGVAQESGWEQLAGAVPLAVNVVTDGKGVVRRRPGIEATTQIAGPSIASVSDITAGRSVDLLHQAYDGSIYAVTANAGGRRVYRITDSGWAEVSGSFRLQGDERPMVAETDAILVFAAGSTPSKALKPAGTISDLAGSPPAGTHICAQGLRLLMNSTDNPSRIYYSGPNSGGAYNLHEQWTEDPGVSGFFEADAKPDRIVALFEHTNEVFAFGETTLQVFGQDAVDVYTPAAVLEYGCIGSSVIRFDQTFAWIEPRGRVVVSDGRSYDQVAQPLKKTLSDMTLTDAYGYRLTEGTQDCLVWNFPTDGKSFAFSGQSWGEWRSYSNGVWTPWPVTSTVSLSNGDTLVGTSDGNIGRFRQGVTTDFGNAIPAEIWTGFQDRDTSRRKHCQAVRLTLRRGTYTSGSEPVAFLSWRDDEGDWESPVAIDLGSALEREPVVSLYSLGTYRTRQWRFQFSGLEDIVLAKAIEEYEVLDS